jgi:dihydrofolate reductase
MGKAFLYMNMTLDGFLSGPKGELDWFDPSKGDKKLYDDIVRLINSADTWMMGYPTGPGLVGYWRNVEDKGEADDWEMEIARAVNKLHPIIISNKSEEVRYGAEIIVARDDRELVDAVKKTKERLKGDIYVPGGVRTAQNFSRLGLIDEYVMLVHPVGIGEGKGLFTNKIDLELMSTKTYKSGVVQMRYRPKEQSFQN